MSTIREKLKGFFGKQTPPPVSEVAKPEVVPIPVGPKVKNLRKEAYRSWVELPSGEIMVDYCEVADCPSCGKKLIVVADPHGKFATCVKGCELEGQRLGV